MSKKIISTLLVVLLLFVAFAACAPSENTESAVGSSSAESSVVQESSKPSTGTSSKIVIRGDVMQAFTPLEDKIKNCPIVVRGKVTKQDKAVEVIVQTDVDRTSTIVRTYYEVEVLDLIAGDQKYAKKTYFWVLGGETENMIHIVDGAAPLPKIGSERFLFMFEDGDAYYNGFIVQENGQVAVTRYDLPEMFKDEPEGVNAKSIPADEFAEILRDKIAEVNAQKKQ